VSGKVCAFFPLGRDRPSKALNVTSQWASFSIACDGRVLRVARRFNIKDCAVCCDRNIVCVEIDDRGEAPLGAESEQDHEWT
jgi:hypothetical protein